MIVLTPDRDHPTVIADDDGIRGSIRAFSLSKAGGRRMRC